MEKTIVIGLVCHINIDELNDFVKLIENLPYLKVVFFKTSSTRLWIKEGDAP